MKIAVFGVILVWLLSATVMVDLVTLALANPIPVPVLLMPLEYINGTISIVDSRLLAEIDGIYPFANFGYETVEMYYPVPPNAVNISVEIDEMQLSWVYSPDKYPTVTGDWPMIEWRSLLSQTISILVYTMHTLFL